MLAPVASTVIGAGVIWWRAGIDAGHHRHGVDPIGEHQALLRALAHGPAGQSATVRVRVDQPVAE